MRSTTLISVLVTCLATSAVWAQEISAEWQQTGINTSGVGSEFSHIALRADFQAILANYERRRYPSTSSSIADPTLTRVTLGGQYLFELTQQHALWPRLKLHSGYTDNISSNNLTYNPQLVSIYKPNQRFALAAGAGALLHRTENQYYPVFGLVLLSNEHSKWSGNLTIPEGLIAYQISDKLFAQLGLKWQTRHYELGDTTPHYIKTQDILLSAGYRYQLDEKFHINLRATYATARQIRYFDSNASFTNERNPASTFGLHASLSYSF